MTRHADLLAMLQAKLEDLEQIVYSIDERTGPGIPYAAAETLYHRFDHLAVAVEERIVILAPDYPDEEGEEGEEGDTCYRFTFHSDYDPDAEYAIRLNVPSHETPEETFVRRTGLHATCIHRYDRDEETRYQLTPWLQRWIIQGDNMPCPACDETRLKTADGITICYACGWQSENIVNQRPELFGE